MRPSRQATSALQSSAPIAPPPPLQRHTPLLLRPARPSRRYRCAPEPRPLRSCCIAGGACPIHCSGTAQHLRPSRRYRCAAGAATACPLAAWHAALPAPGPPAQLGLDVPYRSPAIFVPTASNLGAAIICPNSSTASLVQPQRPPASSTQLLYRRRSPPYLLQRHTPLLLRPAPASLAPLPLRCRSRDRLPSSGMACGPASARTACSVGP